MPSPWLNRRFAKHLLSEMLHLCICCTFPGGLGDPGVGAFHFHRRSRNWKDHSGTCHVEAHTVTRETRWDVLMESCSFVLQDSLSASSSGQGSRGRRHAFDLFSSSTQGFLFGVLLPLHFLLQKLLAWISLASMLGKQKRRSRSNLTLLAADRKPFHPSRLSYLTHWLLKHQSFSLFHPFFPGLFSTLQHCFSLKAAKGGVLFIDEAYELGKGPFGVEACTAIVAAMTDPKYRGATWGQVQKVAPEYTLKCRSVNNQSFALYRVDLYQVWSSSWLAILETCIRCWTPTRGWSRDSLTSSTLKTGVQRIVSICSGREQLDLGIFWDMPGYPWIAGDPKHSFAYLDLFGLS